MSKSFTATFLLVFLSTLALCTGQGISVRGNRLTLHNSKWTCSPNMACRMAVCIWQRIPRITDDNCTYLNSHCSCPEDDICAMTGNFSSRNNLITVQYRCRNPSVVFRDQQRK